MKERCIQGLAVSDGIAIAFPYFLPKTEISIPSFTICAHEVEREIIRYRNALSSSRADLEKLHCDLAKDGSAEIATIIYSHLQILDDPFLTTEMEEKIRTMQRNTESVFHSAISDYEKRFSQTEDDFFTQRLTDVKEIAMRVLAHLHASKPALLPSDVPEFAVLVSRELTPLVCTAADGKNVCGFVSERGGMTSHAALIARAKRMPYVTGIDVQSLAHDPAQVMIVDGHAGCVILAPNPETLQRYRRKQEQAKQSLHASTEEACAEAKTRDGHALRVLVNIGGVQDLSEIEEGALQGVGLFRTEFLLFRDPNVLLREEEQWRFYRDIVRMLKGRMLTFRVFDLGRDKQIAHPLLAAHQGIRFLLNVPELFILQLRAILRAAVEGPVRLLLPLVASVSELRKTRALIAQVEEDLGKENAAFQKGLPVGCMIELPEAVDACAELARESDFLSIGTNDLMQCVLGQDRAVASAAQLCAHPALLRMIAHVQKAAEGKPLSVCGEMVAHPQLLRLLLGLHIEEVSCAAHHLATVKRTIRQCALSDAVALAERALALETPEQVLSLSAFYTQEN